MRSVDVKRVQLCSASSQRIHKHRKTRPMGVKQKDDHEKRGKTHLQGFKRESHPGKGAPLTELTRFPENCETGKRE